MKNYLLSILIPAKNEEFLANTVEDILKNIEDDTEIIVVLDGVLANPGLPDNERLTIIYLSESIGQRAAQNLACRMSRAKYVMKLDAHVAVDKGFDRKMLEAFEKVDDNTTMVMTMRNLHVFNWVCENCGMKIYQGPKPESCRNETCTFDKQKFKREIVWISKTNPQSTAYRFNKNLQFKYFPELRAVQNKSGLVETMSLQGSCFMCTRENYWKYELCDESWGSWGQQGSEVSLKTTLSNGQVLCNRDTWYAHLFRTQKGFDHPFNIGSSQHNARKICRDIFLNNKWSKQTRPLSYMVEKFWSELQKVKDPENWTEQDLKEQKERELKCDRSGIYRVKCKKNNRIYIGSAKKLSQRFGEHLRMLHRKDHDNEHLQKAWNKYGENNFSFDILYFCDEKELVFYEQKFIDEYKKEIGWREMFNMNPIAGSCLGRKHTQDSLDKMSKQQSGERNGFYGKEHSEESIKKMKEFHKGEIPWNKDIPHTEETKKKISESLKGKEAWNKGLTKETDERVKKYAERMAGRPIWEGEEHPRGMLGKKHSEDTKQRIGEALKENVKNKMRNNNGQFISADKGIIYYTCNTAPVKIAKACQNQLKKISEEKNIPIVSASLKPMANFGKNICFPGERGALTMFRQILIALVNSEADVIFFCEHDCLYPNDYFDFVPTDKNTFYYNINVIKVDAETGKTLKVDVCRQVSGICVYRETAIKHYKERIAMVEKEGRYSRNMGYEPGTHNRVKWQNQYEMGEWQSETPMLDIRHNTNLSPNRWSQNQFRDKRNCKGWTEGVIDDLWCKDVLAKLINK